VPAQPVGCQNGALDPNRTLRYARAYLAAPTTVPPAPEFLIANN
jgi:hypothetical protein